MHIEMYDMIVSLAMFFFHGIKVTTEGLVGSGPEHIDLHGYLGLAQALD